MYRHHPQTRRARDLVAEGAIGRLAHIRATLSFTLLDDADPRSSKALDGGALMDVGCYCVSAARLFAGEPDLVYGQQALEGREVDSRFAGTLRFPDGVFAQFDAGMTLPRRDGLELIGSDGTLVLADPWHCREATIELRYPPVDTAEPPLAGSGARHVPVDPAGALGLGGGLHEAYRFELESFSAAVEGREELEFGREDAVAQARAIEALFRSAETGLPVELGPEP